MSTTLAYHTLVEDFSQGELEGFVMPTAGAADVSPTAVAAAAAGAPDVQLAVAALNVQALMSGGSWTPAGNGPTVVTYSFANSSSVYGSADASFATTLTPFSSADQDLVRQELAKIAAVCNVTFQEVADSGTQHGEIRYAYSAMPNKMGYAGYAYFPGTAAGGDVWIGAGQATAQWDWYRPDLLLHETLHALGLKHPFDGSTTLATASDIIPNTVMSYSTLAGSHVGVLSAYPTEPMGLDVAALQSLYGAAGNNAGDTTYDLGSAQFQSNFHCVWDSGGTDTFDASDIGQGVTLDLRAGGWSDIGVDVGAAGNFGAGTATTTTYAQYAQTLTIAQGTTIEQAVGSAYDDTIITGPGTQFVDGGAGNDTAVFSGTMDQYAISRTDWSYRVTNLQTHLTTELVNVERVDFSNAQLHQASGGTVAADSDYAEAMRLYKAALDRVPDQTGVAYWTHALESGATLPQLAASFISSAEFQQKYATVQTNADFVALLYQNVLDRAPDAGGLAYWTGAMNSGALARPDVLAQFSESHENQVNTEALLVGVAAPGQLVQI